MAYSFPRIELTEAHEIWLRAAVNDYFEDKPFDVNKVKIEIWNRTGQVVKRSEIDNRLLLSDNPTLLGIWHADPDNAIIEQVEKAIGALREIVLKEPDTTTIAAHEFAKRIGLSESDVKLVFHIIGNLQKYCSGAFGQQATRRYDGIHVQRDYIIDNYLDYNGIEDAVRRLFEERAPGAKDGIYRGSNYVLGDDLGIHEKRLFISENRICEIEHLQERKTKYDFTRLIQLCREANVAYANSCYLTVAILVRAITDHLAPLFGEKSFNQAASSYKWSGRTPKRQMERLANSHRDVANNLLHEQIGKRTSIVTEIHCGFATEIDALLEETVKIIHNND